MNSEFQSQLNQLEQEVSSLEGGRNFREKADEIKNNLENRVVRQIYDIHKLLSILFQKKKITGNEYYKKLRQLNEASAELPDKLTADERINQHALNFDSLPYFIDKANYRDVTKEYLKYLHGNNTAHYKQTPDGKSAFIIARDSENKVEFIEKTTRAHRMPLDKFVASTTVNPYLIDSSHIAIACNNSIQRWYKHQDGSWYRDEQVTADQLDGQPRSSLFRILPNGLFLIGVTARDHSFVIVDPEADDYEKVVAQDNESINNIGAIGYADGYIFTGQVGRAMLGAKFTEKKICRHQLIDGNLTTKEIISDQNWNVEKIQAISKNEIYLGVNSSWKGEGAIHKLTLDDDGNLVNKNVIRFFTDSNVSDFCILPNGDYIWADKIKRIGVDHEEHNHTRVYKWSESSQNFDKIGDFIGVCHNLQVMPDGKIMVNVISQEVGQFVHILDGEVSDD